MGRSICTLVAVILLALASAATARTWTDSQGNQVNATFVRVHEGYVILSRGGRVIRVPFSGLSSEDREYVRRQLEAKGQGHLLPGRVQRQPSRGPGGSAPGMDIGMPAEATASEDTGFASTPPVAEPIRTWTDVQGRTIQAQFVEVSGGKVVLRKDGTIVSYPLAGFSAADQAYLRGKLGAAGQSGVPAGSGAAPRGSPPMGSNPFFSRPRSAWGGNDEEDNGWENDAGEMDEDDEVFSEDEDDFDDDEDEGLASSEDYVGPFSRPAGGMSGSRGSMGSPAGGMGGSRGSMGSPAGGMGGSRPPTVPRGPSRGPRPPIGSRPDYAGGAESEAETQIWYCSNCNKEVPAHLGAGDRCPHCKVRWDYEETADGRIVNASGHEVSRWWVKVGGASGFAAIVVVVLGLLVRLAASRD